MKSKNNIKSILKNLKIKKPRQKIKPPKVETSKKTYNRKKEKKIEID